MKIRLALDAMGGDNAPFAPVKALEDPAILDAYDVILAGDETKIKPLLPADVLARVTIDHCEKAVPMDDKVSLKLLRDKDNTMTRVVTRVKEGKADCALSAGNTAAFVTFAISLLGMLPGVERPAIAIPFPTATGSPLILLDVGANINAKPLHFLQYAVMGACYAENVFGIARPRVALLNIGEEPTKGDELRREAHAMLRNHGESLNFAGNLEGQDLLSGHADVVITDGFTGNVILKTSEGIFRSFRTILKQEITRGLTGKIGSFILRRHFGAVARKVDYADYGGAILLGVNGPVIISHGRSSPRAMASALKLGGRVVEHGFLPELSQRLERTAWAAP